jgi:hypothetical protein
MALNLSTLTNPATSGGILAEALTTADFLDPCPILKNLSRGSNKGGDAKQTTALNQPKALPLDANGKGYCYLPATTGNAPAVTFPTIGANDDFVLEMVAYVVNSDAFHLVTGANGNNRFAINYSFNTHFFDGYTQIPLTREVTILIIFRSMASLAQTFPRSTDTSRPARYLSAARSNLTSTSRPPTCATGTPSSNARLAKW